MGADIVAELVDAASRGNREHLTALAGTGVLDRRDFSDRTALMAVADAGDLPAVAMLLAAGADPNVRNHIGRSALMYAAYRCHTEVVRALLAGGADANLRDRRGRTALDCCRLVPDKNVACVLALQAGGAQAGAKAPRGLRRAVRDAIAGDQFSDHQQRADLWIGLLLGAFGYAFGLLLLSFVFRRALALGMPWQAFGVALCAVLCAGLIVRLVVPLFPAVIRLAARVGGTPRFADSESSSGTEHVDVRSPAFLCAILEQGERQFGRWHRRKSSGSVLADEGVDGPLLLSVGIAAVTLLGVALIPLRLLQEPVNSGRLDAGATVSALVNVAAGVSPWYLGFGLVGLWVVETYLRGVRLRLAQRRIDGLAADVNRLLDQASYGGTQPNGPFAVYLRPFYLTNRLQVGGPDLETLLAYSFRPYMPIIALGRPGEHFGAGRIATSDTHWRDDITRLVDASEMILCIPSATEGTLWELALLAERGLLDKTIFIMPAATKSVNYQYEWASVRASPVQQLLAFPSYVPDGLVFRLSHGGGVEAFSPLRLESFTLQAMYHSGGGSNDSSESSSERGDQATGAVDGAVGTVSAGAAAVVGAEVSTDFEIDQSFESLGAAMDGGHGSDTWESGGRDSGDGAFDSGSSDSGGDSGSS